MRRDLSLPRISFNSLLTKSHNNTLHETNFNLITQKKPKLKMNRFKLSKLSNSVDPESENIIKTTLDKIFKKDYSGIMDQLKEETFPSQNKKQRIFYKLNQNFKQTKYSSSESLNEFFDKYRKLRIIEHKSPILKLTPSLAFIKSCNKNRLIPNPLGLVKRKGDERTLDLNNQHVGDKYIKALSNSLEYANHLNDFQLSSNRITENGINYLFTSLNLNKSLMQNINKLNLSKNRIGKSGTDNLVNFLQNEKCNIVELNLEDNNLQDSNIIRICDSICNNSKLKLAYLNLGKNEISDNSIESLSNLISICENLKVLILRYNNLGNNSGALIINKIRDLSQLKMLDLSWNKIGDELTQEMLFEEIANLNPDPKKKYTNYELNKCASEKRFHFEKNPFIIKNELNIKSKKDKTKINKIDIITKLKIPEREASNFAKELGKYFSLRENPLVHLDISHNNLPYEDCLLLSKESKKNHSILGIHVDGNEMEINSLGFIIPIDKFSKTKSFYSKIHIFNNIDSNLELSKSNIEKIKNIRSRNKCWICEGWREIEFIFKPKENIIDPQFHLVKIHFNFDNFKPCDMIGNGIKYTIIRMCPPGNIFYFYSVDSEIVDFYGDDNYIIDKHPIIYTFDNSYFEELNNIKLKNEINENNNNDNNENNENNNNEIINNENNENEKKVTIHILGKRNIEKNYKVIDEDFLKVIKYCEARPGKIKNKIIKPKTPWSFKNSIFYFCGYNYEGESEELINECFEFDFTRCEFNKIIKSEKQIEELKIYLRNYYKNIIECYKYYSSFSGEDIFQITNDSLKEFINKCNNFIDDSYNIENIFPIKNSIISNEIDKEERDNRQNNNLCYNLVRHQFLLFLVQISKDKYINKLNKFKRIIDAVKYSFENHFENSIKGFDNNIWRKERYYNERIDNFLLAYLPLLDGIYKTFIKQKDDLK